MIRNSRFLSKRVRRCSGLLALVLLTSPTGANSADSPKIPQTAKAKQQAISSQMIAPALQRAVTAPAPVSAKPGLARAPSGLPQSDPLAGRAAVVRESQVGAVGAKEIQRLRELQGARPALDAQRAARENPAAGPGSKLFGGRPAGGALGAGPRNTAYPGSPAAGLRTGRGKAGFDFVGDGEWYDTPEGRARDNSNGSHQEEWDDGTQVDIVRGPDGSTNAVFLHPDGTSNYIDGRTTRTGEIFSRSHRNSDGTSYGKSTEEHRDGTMTKKTWKEAEGRTVTHIVRLDADGKVISRDVKDTGSVDRAEPKDGGPDGQPAPHDGRSPAGKDNCEWDPVNGCKKKPVSQKDKTSQPGAGSEHAGDGQSMQPQLGPEAVTNPGDPEWLNSRGRGDVRGVHRNPLDRTAQPQPCPAGPGTC